ncbi:MAG TPA: DNA polymerase III subunit delta [Clostridiales bacterium]|nr:DNA polymerase III subunit delta [Clostridiales bacterium]
MEQKDFRDRIAKDPKGWYLFVGEEEYLKRYHASLLREKIVTDAAFAPFNHLVFDGPEIDVPKLSDAIKAPPMMSDYKLVEWRYPDFEHMKESVRGAVDDLAPLKEEFSYTVLLLSATADGFDPGTAKRPSKLATRYGKLFDIVPFPKSTDAQLLGWLKRHFDAEGIRTDADSLRALVFRSGHLMDILIGEVEKLAAYLKANGRDTLTPADVEAVASSTLECDTFALSNAVIDRNRALAFRALLEMKRERTDPAVLIGMLTRTYSELVSVALLSDEGADAPAIEAALKIPAFKVRMYLRTVKSHGVPRLVAALDSLTKVDAASKLGGVDGYAAVELFLAQNL